MACATIRKDPFHAERLKSLSTLRKLGLNYSYSRIKIEDKYSSDDIKNWNSDMALWQRLRVKKSQNKDSSGEDEFNAYSEEEAGNPRDDD